MHQLPVLAIVAEYETGFAREGDHRGVGAQRVTIQSLSSEGGGAAFEILQERRADAVSLPTVGDRQAELKTLAVGMERIARLAHDGLETIDGHGRNDCKALVRADMGEAIEQALRQFAHRAQKTAVAGAGRKRAEVVL